MNTENLTPFGHRLRETVKEAWKRPYYREHWKLSNLEDALALVDRGRLDALPVLRKTDIRDHWEGLIDPANCVDVVSSSGTTGRPVDVPIHRVDSLNRIHAVRRTLEELGVREGSRILIMFNLNDLFAFGPQVWEAAKSLGAITLRGSGARVGRMLQLCEQWRPEFVVGNPQVLIRVSEEAGASWPDTSLLPSRALYAAAATFDNDCKPTALAQQMVERWGLTEYLNHLGCSETGPVAVECKLHRGAHVHDDFLYAQLVDPVTGELITDARTPGELVVTALTWPRGFIPVRYSTGDIVGWLDRSPCACGRTSPRLGPVIGRIDDQLKFESQSMYPELLLGVVDKCPLIANAVVRASKNVVGDFVEVLVVPAPGAEAEAAVAQAKTALSRIIAVLPTIVVVEAEELRALQEETLKRTNGSKMTRFFDLRRSR